TCWLSEVAMICWGVNAEPRFAVVGALAAGGQLPVAPVMETGIRSRLGESAPSIWLPSGKVSTRVGEPPGPAESVLLQVLTKGVPLAPTNAALPLASMLREVALAPSAICLLVVSPLCRTKTVLPLTT